MCVMPTHKWGNAQRQPSKHARCLDNMLHLLQGGLIKN